MAFPHVQSADNQELNRAYGRGLFSVDQEEANKKAQKQKQYQRQLQLQVEAAKKRKLEQKEKIRKEDEKWQREIEAIEKAEKEKNKKHTKINKNQPSSPQNLQKSQHSYHYNKNAKKGSMPSLGLDFSVPIDENYGKALKTEHPQYDIPPIMQVNQEQENYMLEARMNKYRDQLDAKVDEIFGQIRMSKDVLQTEEELDKIKQRLRRKPLLFQDLQNRVDEDHLDEFSKFYSIPKSNKLKESGFRNLDNQGYSKYHRNGSSKARHKSSAPYEDLDEYQTKGYGREKQSQKHSRWGERVGQNNFLSNREALDFQIDSLMGRIDNIMAENDY